MWTELIALLVSYFGVFMGFGLSKIAKPEVSAGKLNLTVLRYVLLIAVVFSFLIPITAEDFFYKIIFIIIFQPKINNS